MLNCEYFLLHLQTFYYFCTKYKKGIILLALEQNINLN